MRSTILLMVLAALLVLGLSGCASLGAPGALYSNASYAGPATNNDVGQKTGESCKSYFLLFNVGGDHDKPPLATAAKNAGIQEIGTVNYEFTNILGIYRKACVMVSGN